MRWLASTVTLGLLLMPLGALACDSNSVTNPGMLECVYEAYGKADAILNQQYRAALQDKRLDTEALRHVQRAWLTYRDAYCEAVLESEGGNGEAKVMKGSCLLDLTGSRIGELVYYRVGAFQDGFGKAGLVDPTFEQKLREEPLTPAQAGYFEGNCRFVVALHGEPYGHCMKRMRFQAVAF